MEDAATLVALLRAAAARQNPNEDAIEPALARYDQLRRPRTQKIAKRSRAVGQLAHTKGPGVTAARNLMLRLTPSAAVSKQLQGTQSWKPPAG